MVRALHFYLEKAAALSLSIVPRRVALTHTTKAISTMASFLFLQIRVKYHHGEGFGLRQQCC